MALYENATEFFGRPIRDWTPAEAASYNYTVYVPRLRLDYDEAQQDGAMTKLLEALLAQSAAPSLTALVIGMWGESDTSSSVVVDALVRLKDRLPNLEALFFGDIISEENEMSWINQSDISALWPAFPNLRELRIRGGNGLAVGRITLPKLESLIIETGGMGRNVVSAVLGSPLQSVKHLELWLGTDEYGSDTSAADFTGLELANMPALQSLGLCNCHYADDLAQVLAKAPILSRIKRLDLSLGTLGDVGGEAILSAPAFARLEALDLHHNFLSEPVAERLKKLGPQVNVDDRQEEEEDYRYVAVGE